VCREWLAVVRSHATAVVPRLLASACGLPPTAPRTHRWQGGASVDHDWRLLPPWFAARLVAHRWPTTLLADASSPHYVPRALFDANVWGWDAQGPILRQPAAPPPPATGRREGGALGTRTLRPVGCDVVYVGEAGRDQCVIANRPLPFLLPPTSPPDPAPCRTSALAAPPWVYPLSTPTATAPPTPGEVPPCHPVLGAHLAAYFEVSITAAAAATEGGAPAPAAVPAAAEGRPVEPPAAGAGASLGPRDLWRRNAHHWQPAGAGSSHVVGDAPCVAVGLASRNFRPESSMPGWDQHSIAYHGDDGLKYWGSGTGRRFGERFGAGDTVGCGIAYLGATAAVTPAAPAAVGSGAGCHGMEVLTPSQHRRLVKACEPLCGHVFFTLNGALVDVATSHFPLTGPWYPCVGIDAPFAVSANFGARPFRFPLAAFSRDLWRCVAGPGGWGSPSTAALPAITAGGDRTPPPSPLVVPTALPSLMVPSPHASLGAPAVAATAPAKAATLSCATTSALFGAGPGERPVGTVSSVGGGGGAAAASASGLRALSEWLVVTAVHAVAQERVLTALAGGGGEAATLSSPADRARSAAPTYRQLVAAQEWRAASAAGYAGVPAQATDGRAGPQLAAGGAGGAVEEMAGLWWPDAVTAPEPPLPSPRAGFAPTPIPAVDSEPPGRSRTSSRPAVDVPAAEPAGEAAVPSSTGAQVDAGPPHTPRSALRSAAARQALAGGSVVWADWDGDEVESVCSHDREGPATDDGHRTTGRTARGGATAGGRLLAAVEGAARVGLAPPFGGGGVGGAGFRHAANASSAGGGWLGLGRGASEEGR
jgi:hypothetical protein